MARIAFLQSFWFEFLGVMYISAYLKAHHHEVQLFIGDRISRLVDEVLDYDPDIIAFSCSSGNHQWASILAGEIKKKRNIRAVMGGPHPTYYPEAIRQPHIDFLIRAEGEEAMLELVETLARGESYQDIENLVYLRDNQPVVNPLRPLIEDLDTFPTPDRQLYYQYRYLRKNRSKHVITGRGCPYNCAFCCNKSYKMMYQGKGRMVRRHSVERIISDITILKERYGVSTIRFDDEVFILSPEWLDTFLEQYTRVIGLPFSCLIRADLLHHDLAQKLKQAGCYIAYFGIESGDDHLRNQVLKKGVTRDQIVNTAHYLKSAGILMGTFNMLGLPGETIKMGFETVALNQLIKADYPWCSILQPYPNTELEAEAIRDGYIRDCDHINTLSSSYFNRSLIRNEHSRELENLQKFFFLAVKFPFLTGIIEKIIRFEPNFLFDFLFQITYAYRYMKTYRISLLRIASYALRMKSHF
ncbi:B12-binding domain-containing radical SAM protein [candidate division CSSED10-310 bacterium]|uniref:B12-binding domain-containing radical SAM protein n=1 Tax=candidate division CSSED10-310 bacterium TaxID=2855610 RepID=A0ABV6YRI0_UNCC1